MSSLIPTAEGLIEDGARKRPLLLHITYAEQDEDWVRGVLVPGLGLSEGQYWTRAEADLGRLRLEELERAVKACRYTLLVASHAAKFDAWTNFAAVLAQHAGVEDDRDRLLVVTRDFDPSSSEAKQLLPLRQRCLACLDCSEAARREEAFARLSAQLALAATELPVVVECPYPGLRVFGSGDASNIFHHPELFFGRDEEGRSIVERLGTTGRVLLVGPSGCGKSSLVRARVLPAFNGSANGTRVVGVRPAGDPDAALRAALRALDPSLEDCVDRYVHACQQGKLAELAPWQRPGGDLHRDLLYIDPFEEVFVATGQDAERARAAFFARLAALWRVPGLAVLISMRADFTGDLMCSSLWQDLKTHRVELDPLRGAGLRDAIVLPARHVGVHVEADLVERLVREAERDRASEALPLLQVALEQLWQHRQWRYLSLESYSQLVAGNQRGLDAVLSRYADRCLEELSEAQREVARRLLVELVILGEGRSDTRRRRSVNELYRSGDDPQVVGPVLDLLAARRLISVGSESSPMPRRDGAEPADVESSHRYADLAHDTLITGWPTLANWLREHRDDLRTQRRLEGRAASGGRLSWSELPEFTRWLSWIASPEGQAFKASDKLRELVGKSVAARRRIYAVLAMILVISMVFAAVFRAQNLDLRQERTKTNRSIGAATKTAAMVVYELDFKLRTIAGAAEVREVLLERARALLVELRSMGDLGAEKRTDVIATLGQAALAAERGDFATARQLYLKGLEVQRALNTEEPPRAKRQRDVMVTLNRLGDLAVSTSDLVAARDWYSQGLEIAQLLTRQDAGNRLWEQDLLFSYEKLGDVELAVGERGAATRRYEQARQGYERMIARYGTHPMAVAALAAVYGKLGNVAIDAEDVRAARYWIDRGLRAEERLVAADPANADRLTNLALFHERLGDVEVLVENPREAQRQFERALEILTPLAARDGTYARWQRGLVSCQLKLGKVAVALGELGVARDLFERGLLLAQAHADRGGEGDEQQQRDVMKALGDVLFSMGDLPMAKTWYERGGVLGEKILERCPSDASCLLGLATLYDSLGDIALSEGQKDPAQQWYERSLGLRQRAAQGGNEDVRRELSLSYNRLGDLALGQGRGDEARRSYQQALEERQQLLLLVPGSLRLRRDLAVSYQRLGNVELAMARYALARGWYEKEYAIEAALVEQNRAPWNLYWLLITHLKLATVSQAQGLSGEVAEHLDRAEALYEELRRDGAFASHAELRRVEAAIAELRR